MGTRAGIPPIPPFNTTTRYFAQLIFFFLPDLLSSLYPPANVT